MKRKYKGAEADNNLIDMKKMAIDKSVLAVIDAAREALAAKIECAKYYETTCKKCGTRKECAFAKIEKALRKYDKLAKLEANSGEDA